jgi:hypothetical protein
MTLAFGQGILGERPSEDIACSALVASNGASVSRSHGLVAKHYGQ